VEPAVFGSAVWGQLLLAALCQQPRRFNELKREFDGITQNR
jgi:DNA-binding HxlR family transcriptional regulator